MTKKSTTPKGFHAAVKKDAIHWITYEHTSFGDVYRSKNPTETIACGTPIDCSGDWRSRTTKDTMAISCWACAQKAMAAGFKTRGEAPPKMF